MTPLFRLWYAPKPASNASPGPYAQSTPIDDDADSAMLEASSGTLAISTVAHITCCPPSKLLVPLVVGDQSCALIGFEYPTRRAGATTPVALSATIASAGAIGQFGAHVLAFAGNPSAYHPLAAELGRIMATVSKVSEIP